MKNPASQIPSQPNNNNTQEVENDDTFSQVDIVKILEILRKSILWVFVFLALGVGGAFLYLRYTKPVYKSTSQLQIKNDNEDKQRFLSGFGGMNQNAG